MVPEPVNCGGYDAQQLEVALQQPKGDQNNSFASTPSAHYAYTSAHYAQQLEVAFQQPKGDQNNSFASTPSAHNAHFGTLCGNSL